MFGHPEWSHMNSVSSSSSPSGVIRPVLMVTCGMDNPQHLVIRGYIARVSCYLHADPKLIPNWCQPWIAKLSSSINAKSRSPQVVQRTHSPNLPALDKTTPPDWLQWKERNTKACSPSPQLKRFQDFALHRPMFTGLFDFAPHPGPNRTLVFGRL